MRDHHFYIIIALLLLILYCMMNHREGFALKTNDSFSNMLSGSPPPAQEFWKPPKWAHA
jgi:hypothetical protein